MGGYGTNAIVFLIQTIFSLYLIAIMVRFLLQLTRADFYNPVSQFLVKITNPLLIPLRRVIPGFMGVDFAAIVLMLTIKIIELFLILLLQGMSITVSGILVLSIAELFKLLINVYFFSILIQVIIGWINPGAHNPVVSLLYSLNEPLLGRARRLIPPISGFDLSPIIVIIVLQLIAILFIAPITDLGRTLAISNI
ncbi:MAG: YggT family protein [Gammaproteobacteria bacterium]|nr:YggT family protein [Gammaproteobacteria bacterium]